MEQSSCGMFFVEDALEMILMFDETGRITCANAEARKNLEYGDDLPGKNISEIFPECQSDPLHDLLSRLPASAVHESHLQQTRILP